MTKPTSSFPDTHWSLIVNVRDGTEAQAAEALDRLCRAYWPPLYAFARKWGVEADSAADAVQEFLAHFISRGDLRRPSPELGRFRSFLLAAFQNHLVSEHRRKTAQKRGGKVIFISLEDAVREERWLAHAGSAEQAFDLRWAEETMERALAQVGADFERAGNAAIFHALRPTLCGGEVEDMAAAGARVGLSAGAMRSAVFRVRAKFREALRSEVSQTVARAEEVEDEIRYLLTLLAQ